MLNACASWKDPRSSMDVFVLHVTLPQYVAAVRYRRAVKRLTRELDDLGARFGKKILCDSVRKELQQKAGLT